MALLKESTPDGLQVPARKAIDVTSNTELSLLGKLMPNLTVERDCANTPSRSPLPQR